MEYTQEHLQFFQVIHRLKRIDWTKQFKTLCPHEYIALCTLTADRSAHPEARGMYVTAFARELSVPVPAASKLLKVLEDKGWIAREIDPASRRNTFVIITPEGEDIFRQESEYCAAMGSRIFDKMGKENVTALLNGINQLLDLTEEEFQ